MKRCQFWKCRFTCKRNERKSKKKKINARKNSKERNRNYGEVYKRSKRKAIEVTLWEAANKLRGRGEPAEYKHVVLGLIFLKFASDMIFIPSLITGGGVTKFF